MTEKLNIKMDGPQWNDLVKQGHRRTGFGGGSRSSSEDDARRNIDGKYMSYPSSRLGSSPNRYWQEGTARARPYGHSTLYGAPNANAASWQYDEEVKASSQQRYFAPR